MENRQQQILSEIKEMMSSIREQLERLDAKMAELQYEVDPQQYEVALTDFELDDMSVGISDSVEESPAIIDAMTAKQAWRKDLPGAQVRDVRSAISLNDRVLFINALFGEDPLSFQDTLTRINQMSTLDDAVSFLTDAHPAWDWESEIVYRFMMAIRRRLS